jgi:hypothetical protein
VLPAEDPPPSCISLVTGLFWSADDLIATTIGMVLPYVYLRFIRKNGDVRGDPKFEVAKLLPSCGAPEQEPSGSDDGDDGENLDLRLGGMTSDTTSG